LLQEAIRFVLLVLTARDGTESGSSGISLFELTAAAAGLLFAIILDHNSLRDATASQLVLVLAYWPTLLGSLVAVTLVVFFA
jgi:hypothetical protein